jgi:hypothetical protein
MIEVYNPDDPWYTGPPFYKASGKVARLGLKRKRQMELFEGSRLVLIINGSAMGWHQQARDRLTMGVVGLRGIVLPPGRRPRTSQRSLAVPLADAPAAPEAKASSPLAFLPPPRSPFCRLTDPLRSLADPLVGDRSANNCATLRP